jgi:hypothetical protein
MIIQLLKKGTACWILPLILCSDVCFGQETVQINDTTTLAVLKGSTQTFNYSPGQENRAKNIAAFIEQAVVFFRDEISFTPQTTFYILAPRHWKALAAKPLTDAYGFPHNPDKFRLVIAAEDNNLWRSFLPPVDKIPAPLAARVKKAYGKQDGTYSMMPFFDLLALHEMGHSYTAQAGVKMHRHWMGELFVNIMLHTYVAEKQPELLPALEVFPDMVVSGGSAEYKFTSLEDFERLYTTLGMGPKNYGWYQCKFHATAKEIYNAGGKEVLIKLWASLKMHQEKMTDKAFADMLQEEVHPAVAEVFLNWNR